VVEHCTSKNPPNLKRLCHENDFCALMILGTKLDSPLIKELESANITAMLMDSYVKNPKVSCVSSDNINSVAAIVEHLTRLGHRKIGFLGGAFDPVHNGHLVLACCAARQAGLDVLYFLPAAQSPLKAAAGANANQRLEMLRLSLDFLPDFPPGARAGICDLELRRAGVSYTVDTLRAMRKILPRAQIFWIIGADKLAELPHWKEAPALLRLAEFICAPRPQFSLEIPQGLRPFLRVRFLEGLCQSEASRDFRGGKLARETLRQSVPPPVWDYILRERLYGLCGEN
jgi:nicotinate-nucleotide adenylyltransferase